LNSSSGDPARRKPSLRLALAGLALLASAPLRAFDLDVQETRPGLRLSAGIDVFRTPGTVVATGRYGGTWGARLGYWVRSGSDVGPRAPVVLIGADYMLTFWKRVRGGIGLAWIDGENNVNGTRWNFDTTLAYDLSDRLFVEYRHQSHGAALGIRKDAPNGGWNVVGLGYTF
jgi:hypothetical protein